MNEHPILFSTDMVKAILNGTKTQTRRVIKPKVAYNANYESINGLGYHQWYQSPILMTYQRKCPYGISGNKLWIRETWSPVMSYEDGVAIRYKDNTELFREVPEELCDWHEREWTRHDNFFKSQGVKNSSDREFDYDGLWIQGQYWPFEKWHPSIHMPKFCARIWLDVLSIRVAKLQDISEDDAIAEGISGGDWLGDPIGEFAKLWDSINKKRGYGWDKNPWVWVVNFPIQNRKPTCCLE